MPHRSVMAPHASQRRISNVVTAGLAFGAAEDRERVVGHVWECERLRDAVAQVDVLVVDAVEGGREVSVPVRLVQRDFAGQRHLSRSSLDVSDITSGADGSRPTLSA
jgi:hypothetical protein